MRDTRHKPAWLLFVWMLVIFATSCTRVTKRGFVAAMGRLLGDRLGDGFPSFWARYWFFFVKGYHFVEYAILQALCYWTLSQLGVRARLALLSSAGLCVLYAASDEWHQTFVPRRGGTAKDVLIDSTGVCFASAMIVVTRMRRRR